MIAQFFTWLFKHYRPRNCFTPLCSERFARFDGHTVVPMRRFYIFGVLAYEHQERKL